MKTHRRFVSRLSSHTFLTYFLSQDSVVVDLGVNHGDFAGAMIRKFGCRVYGMEPVPELFAEVSSIPNLVVEQCAVGPEAGTQTLHIFSKRCASMGKSLPGEESREVVVDTVPLEVFLQRHQLTQIDLLKVDIEGTELEILPKIPPAVLAGIRQIAVEFHDFIYPETAPEVQRVIRYLHEAGFASTRFSKDNIDILFINKRWFQNLTLIQLVLHFWFRPLMAVTRKTRRLFGNLNPDHF